MPTNLKTLLKRSRSKTELKNKEEGTATATAPTGLSVDVNTSPDDVSILSAIADHLDPSHGGKTGGNLLAPPMIGGYFHENLLEPGTGTHSHFKRNLSSKSLYTYGTGGEGVGAGDAAGKDIAGKLSPTMRKSETILALTSLTTSTGSAAAGATAGAGSGSKAKAVKDKLLSNSSITLSNLLNSSTRQLFSGLKLSSPGSPAPPRAKTPQVGGPPDSDGLQSQSPAVPLTPTNRLRKNWSHHHKLGQFSNHSSMTSLNSISSSSRLHGGLGLGRQQLQQGEVQSGVPCKICLCSVSMEETVQLAGCGCRFCKECLSEYLSFEILQGAVEIACPDAACAGQGVLASTEIEELVSISLLEKFRTFCLHREVEQDSELTWCPTPGCETICRVEQGTPPPSPAAAAATSNVGKTELPSSGNEKKPKKWLKLKSKAPKAGAAASAASSSSGLLRISCSKCQQTYCAQCKLSYHFPQEPSCEAWRKKLVKTGQLSTAAAAALDDDSAIAGLASIKKCPYCHVPIEKDSGCAQMLCKRCKHVFCWFCLTSLDNDFFLMHYSKGVCKNKLGHSRASVAWHRIQVCSIFAGFGILVLLASPILLLASPCILCCHCRFCVGKPVVDLGGGMDSADDEFMTGAVSPSSSSSSSGSFAELGAASSGSGSSSAQLP